MTSLGETEVKGVLYVGNQALPGAAPALKRLLASEILLLCVTNTTRSTASQILKRLSAMDLHIESTQLFTAPMAAYDYVRARDLHPFLLIHPALRDDFADVDGGDNCDAVLIGDAGDGFTYDRLNRAFRLLLDGAPLIAMGHNRYFQEADGLSLDAGPFITALEYASGNQAVVTGKPSNEFFTAALSRLGCTAQDAIMVGDDIEADVLGAINAGLRGVLVQTGKYRSGDEDQLPRSGGYLLDDFSCFVDWLTNSKQ